MQKGLRGREAQAAIATGKFFHEPKIAQFHDEPALIGGEEAVDFRLANRLLKSDTGEHFEGSAGQKKIPARESVRSNTGLRHYFRPG